MTIQNEIATLYRLVVLLFLILGISHKSVFGGGFTCGFVVSGNSASPQFCPLELWGDICKSISSKGILSSDLRCCLIRNSVETIEKLSLEPLVRKMWMFLSTEFQWTGGCQGLQMTGSPRKCDLLTLNVVRASAELAPQKVSWAACRGWPRASPAPSPQCLPRHLGGSTEAHTDVWVLLFHQNEDWGERDVSNQTSWSPFPKREIVW